MEKRFCLLFIFLFVGFTPQQTLSNEIISGPIYATVVNIVDGDTIDVRAQIWLEQIITTRVRINGIDTPEIKGKCSLEREMAKKAKRKVSSLIAGHPISLSNIHYGKYAGRVVATVHNKQGIEIGQNLILSGLAYEYHGKKRRAWCQ